MKTTRRTTRKESTHTEFMLTETVETIGSGHPGQARGGELQQSADRAPGEWTHLQEFFIEYPPRSGAEDVPQVKVFANGRQQVRLRVVLSPRNASGEFVPVPVPLLGYLLSLVDYHTGVELPSGWEYHAQANEYTYADWAISNAPNKSDIDYVPHDNRPQSRAGSDVLAPDQVSVDIWVTTDNVASIRVAASIWSPFSGQSFQTRPGAAGNTFDSSVNIEGRPPLNLPISDFSMRQQGIENAHFACTNHYFTLNYEGRNIGLLRVEPYEAPQSYNIYVDSGDSNGWEGVFTICSNGSSAGGGEFHHYDVPTYLDAYPIYPNMARIEQFESGAILYVQHLFRGNQHFYWDNGEAGDVPNRQVYFVDEFGNRHRVRIGSASASDFPWFGIYGKW